MDKHFFDALFQYYNDTNYIYKDMFPQKSIVYPIPFFGDIENAKVITIGVNPSAKEFGINRYWPNNLSVEALSERLRNYYSLNRPPPHPWFEQWEIALNHLSLSYYKSTAAHIDLSFRPTSSISKIDDYEKVCEMIKYDMEWFFQALKYAKNVKLLLMAGTVTKKYYINKFIQNFAHLYGAELRGNIIKKPGKANISFHKLITQKLDVPVFFCSTSPSNQNKNDIGRLSKRVFEYKSQLLNFIE
jgi:hypothetical protein